MAQSLDKFRMPNHTQDKNNQREKQSSLYFLWVETLAKETGYFKDAMHDMLRDKFLGYRTVQTKDKAIETLRSVTDLSKEQMKDYLTEIDMFATESGLMLPKPEDLYNEAILDS